MTLFKTCFNVYRRKGYWHAYNRPVFLSLVFFLKVKERKGGGVTKQVYFPPIYIETGLLFILFNKLIGMTV
jgi:hypothetical protein